MTDAAAVGPNVRGFYERHPYPPPVDSLDSYRGLWQARDRRRVDYHLHWPARRYREDQSILVAGCGTSQAAKHALRWPESRVTGIDFSATSVRHTLELKRKYQLDNLEVHQLAVERVSELGKSFDQIVCTGVLHHLPDPDAGLRALRDVLEPDGAMQLMVYAPYGRTGVYMLQEFCRRVGIEATHEGLQGLIAALSALPAEHPLGTLLRQAPDFREPSALADALLNPQDRAYSVPQVFDFLDRAGLCFGRWLRQAPYDPRCGIMSRLPQSARIAQLPQADRFAAVELFRGSMARHSLVVYRDESAGAAQRISFDGHAWHGYVPIRLPDTIAVEERLPPGVAAVLINRAHTNTDIYLPIDADEKRLFDAIDGERAIAQIAGPPGNLEAARLLFDRLYSHDQVVFDATAE